MATLKWKVSRGQTSVQSPFKFVIVNDGDLRQDLECRSVAEVARVER